MYYDTAHTAVADFTTISLVQDITVDGGNCINVSKTNGDSYSLCLGDSIQDLQSKLEEYENKLQREKIHLGRRAELKGHRVHGRRYKITIPKRSFRNQKGIRSSPSIVS